MKTSPVELRQLELKKVIRGVDATQVKFYLERAADDIETLILENKTLKEEVQRYRKIEKELSEASEKAQESARLVIEKAKQDAASFIQDTQRRNEEIGNQLNKLKSERNDFILQFRKILTSYLSMLESDSSLSLRMTEGEQNENKSESCSGSQETGNNPNA